MVTGGRDKKIAMYQYDEASKSLTLLWERLSEDFVYALSPQSGLLSLDNLAHTLIHADVRQVRGSSR